MDVDPQLPAPADPTSAVEPTSVTAERPAPNHSRIPLLTNLRGGLRLLAFMPVNASDFAPSAREVLSLALLAALIWVGYGRVMLDGVAYFDWYGLAQLVWLGTVVLGQLIIMAPITHGTEVFSRTVTAVAGALPIAVTIAVAVVNFTPEIDRDSWMVYILAILAAAYLYRAKRNVGGEPAAFAAAGAFLTVFVTLWVHGATVTIGPELWYSYDASDESERDWAAAEGTLFKQPELIDRAVGSIAAGQPGRTELYFVGFAGDGEQSVFATEAEFARQALDRRIDLGSRALVLANSPDADAEEPRASGTGLRRALRGIASRMNVDEDVLFLYLTSHGSENATLSVNQSSLPLNDLSATEVAQALDESGIVWRIVVISACYSGSFIPPLRNEHTLIVTAARADRTSFGCSDERELTFFGEALFRDALPVSSSLLDATRRAQGIVTRHEQEEELEPSQPQVYVGEQMRSKLEELALKPIVRGAGAVYRDY